MDDERAEEIMRTVLRIYGLDMDGMPRLKALRRSSGIVGVELLHRSQGTAPRLPFPEWELFDFLDWAKKEEELERWGTFTTAYDLYARRDGYALQER